MKLKYKLPIICILLLIATFASLWFGTQKTALDFIEDYHHKMSLLNIERHTKDMEYSIKSGKRQLWRIIQKLDSYNLNWEESAAYFYAGLEDRVFDKIGLVYMDKTYHITGREELGDLSDRKYIKEAFEGKTVISDPIYSKSDGNYQIVVAIPVPKGSNYEVAGVVIGTIPITNIEEVISSLNINGHGHGLLINKTGSIIVGPESDEFPYGNFFDQIGIDQFRSRNGFIEYKDPKGTEKYAFFKELEETGFYVVIIVTEKDLHAPIHRIFTNNLKFFSITLILCIFIVHFIIKATLKPIGTLIEGMKKAEDGEYTLQVPVKRSDEIGEIGIQFNKTIEAISYRDEELQALNEELAASFEEINETTDKLLKSYFDIIRALIKAIELKDTYTKGHSERVMIYSLMLGKKLNLTNRELEILRHGSILHDIGKIGIPDKVLMKPEKLTDEEYNLIKQHPVTGGAFIGSLEFLEESLCIVRNHHERFDGKGYPDGLKGDEIPLLVRIVSIADSYDAMTSRRVYKKTLSKKAAIEELIRCKGSQFDPYLVDKFIEALSENQIEII